MSAERRQSTNSVLWIISAILVLVIILMMWLIISGSGSARETDLENPPVVGGAAIPTSAPLATVSVDGKEEESEAVVFSLGQSVVIGGLAESGTPMHLKAAPGINSQTYHVYPVGEELVIIEPSGDSDDYPVQADEQEWYRVRASDGLVGWVDARFLQQ